MQIKNKKKKKNLFLLHEYMYVTKKVPFWFEFTASLNLHIYFNLSAHLRQTHRPSLPALYKILEL